MFLFLSCEIWQFGRLIVLMSNLKRYTLYILNMIDLISIVLAHLISYFLRTSVLDDYIPFIQNAAYSDFLFLAIISYFLYNVTILYVDEDFFERSVFREFADSLKLVLFIVTCSLLYLYAVKKGELFSRLYVFTFAALMLVIDSSLRVLVKKLVIPKLQGSSAGEDVLVVTEKKNASLLLKRTNERKDWRYNVKGLVITDEDLTGQYIDDIEIVSNRDNMFDAVHTADFDSVLIGTELENAETLKKWIDQFQKKGKIVHVEISEYYLGDSVKTLDHIGSSAIVTYRVISAMPKRLELFKRIINFLLSLVCLPIFLVITLIVFICDLIESPGNLFIPRVRVGKNNRLFYQYRYRVYRIDAAERIAQGLSPYMRIGTVLKSTHLDGLPMILDVLMGDMSFVGPKSPNLQRYLQMNTRQRNTLSILPGIIGYWSCEDDLVRQTELEQEYIEGWHLLKDISIICVTVFRYITGRSLRSDGDTHVQEELDYVAQITEDHIPLSYDHTLYTPEKNLSRSLYLFFKRFFDIVFSLGALIILSPLMIVLMILVTLDDGGNPFYSQFRIGKDGKRIKIYKYRTMRTDAGDLEKLLTPEQLEQYRKEFKLDSDPRITKFGEMLRKTSLDELPQLFNVLGGSMSLIGPRPIVEEETGKYGRDVGKLLSVKPGLTGYWQAYARNNVTYDTGERQKMEMYYVDHQGFLLDVRIFFKTIIAVIRQEGAE